MSPRISIPQLIYIALVLCIHHNALSTQPWGQHDSEKKQHVLSPEGFAFSGSYREKHVPLFDDKTLEEVKSKLQKLKYVPHPENPYEFIKPGCDQSYRYDPNTMKTTLLTRIYIPKPEFEELTKPKPYKPVGFEEYEELTPPLCKPVRCEEIGHFSQDPGKKGIVLYQNHALSPEFEGLLFFKKSPTQGTSLYKPQNSEKEEAGEQ